MRTTTYIFYIVLYVFFFIIYYYDPLYEKQESEEIDLFEDRTTIRLIGDLCVCGFISLSESSKI